MNTCKSRLAVWVMAAAAIPGLLHAGMVQDTAGRADVAAAFAPMPVTEVRDAVLQWLAQAGPDEAIARSVTALWADSEALSSEAADEVLDRVVESFAIADPVIRELVDNSRGGQLTQPPVLDGIRADAFFHDSVRLWHARWLTQHRFFDEALRLLDQLTADNLVDPAGYFFCRAVCQQQLLDATAARDSLTLLLNHTVAVPARYRAVADMMRQDLEAWSDEGMPQVARVMSDVHRRLDLGRSGDDTQQQEERVVSLLDQLLEELQQQQQQQQEGQGSSGQSQGNQPGDQGATESTVKGTAAEGTADRRELTESGAWGLLDQQAEAKARELIRQQFPANFLDAISRYTQKIAEENP